MIEGPSIQDLNNNDNVFDNNDDNNKISSDNISSIINSQDDYESLDNIIHNNEISEIKNINDKKNSSENSSSISIKNKEDI